MIIFKRISCEVGDKLVTKLPVCNAVLDTPMECIVNSYIWEYKLSQIDVLDEMKKLDTKKSSEFVENMSTELCCQGHVYIKYLY